MRCRNGYRNNKILPHKKLFIDILTKDIDVKHCVLDLIDNSIDSYIRKGYSDEREVSINIRNGSFEIFDNCGGIDKETLINDVFRFGVEELKRDKPTMGLFGIGLKRAVFKLGEKIKLETDDGKDLSILDLDINTWQRSKEWDMEFETGSTKLDKGNKPYTKITVNKIYDDIKNKMNLPSFINDLSEATHIVYTKFIERGISIIINKNKLEAYPITVTYDDRYNPQRYIGKIDGINVDIICGIDPSEKRKKIKIGDKGWNFFCNDRLILVGDISEASGWSGKDGRLPKYHNIYNEFKGLVFLTSDDPSKLPLNTSKTGLNLEDKVYNNILTKMIETARPIIKYLTKKYDKEKTESDDLEISIDELIKSSEEIKVEKVEIRNLAKKISFKAPQPKPKPISVKIRYEKPKIMVDKVKDHLKVTTLKAVGEKTFDYYVKMEEVL